jgi:Na+(H+)/acetate symporter ActP
MKIPPIIKIIFGFFLFLGGLRFRTGYQLYDYLILIFSIVGFAILLNGSRELRKNAQLDSKL